MILVEADNDLAGCVESFFGDRYNVQRVANLRDVAAEFHGKTVGVLFADVDLNSRDQSSIIEKLRRDHPHLTIVLTYLAPAARGPWETQLRDTADIVVRKPYNVLKVDEAIRASGAGYEE